MKMKKQSKTEEFNCRVEFWATCYFIFKLNVAQIFVFWFLVRKDMDFGVEDCDTGVMGLCGISPKRLETCGCG